MGRYDDILSMALSGERDLRTLACRSEYGVFDFYRGANLRGLDLTGQDLTDMNFDGADLRFSTIHNVKFDAGAFNGSVIDETQQWLVDEYEFYARDVFDHPNDEILVYCRIRVGALEDCLGAANINYKSFSDLATVSINALRKARNAGVIALETASKIFKALTVVEAETNEIAARKISNLVKQPSIQFLSGGINMPFKHVSRSRLKELIKMRAEITEIRSERRDGHEYIVRDTPESLEWLVPYYRSMVALE